MAAASKNYQAIVATPFCRVGIRMADEAVSGLDFLADDTPEQSPMNVATAAVVAQLNAYLRDPNHAFTIPLAPAGTVFQRRVWAALCAIPVGTVLTYGELAKQLDSAARAIGGACRSNPIPIMIPCHRVVSQQGLGGYTGQVAGDSLNIKHRLLQHEGVEGIA